MPAQRIKDHFSQQAPFFATVGLVLDQVGPGQALARLENRAEISNHLGTLHAGALFTLGEGTSGAAVMGAFADIMDDIRIVSTEASITYLSIARGTTVCEARLQDPVSAVRAQFEASGQVTCAVTVTIRTATDKEVARLAVTWLIMKRKTKPTPPA